MALFRIVRGAPLSAAEAWRRVTDWRAHAALVPLTRVGAVSTGPVREGSRFTMRTGIGPVGFDDPMEVVRWEPPGPGGAPVGVCRLEKRGRVVTGWAEIEVRETAPGSVRVTWTEALRLRGVPRVCDPVLAGAGKWVFGRALSALMADN
ncbi:SRPBCC family protein [Streptomyces sp. WAC05374]|uniref:SRPBCC family protein n=2 Tax=Streptomyces sp. WAC05374 TaxID=2487420 RepID=UPI0010554E5D|nr:SRPBCC family protein [Streptomyces sp. WAC05374]TDF50601.1 SRPBCC family protein [Streptomyces sp. WAC05374]TDF56891.1 SRPBCC family protein [Streptomyces sp. WAC05374]TDF60854.1 SRPBCC family protein [Streptomyces sp. WAC05374]